MSLVLDAGALIAVERGDDTTTELLRLAVLRHQHLSIPAGALAQVWRDGRQARLNRLLKHAEVVPLNRFDAQAVGALMGARGTSDTVDAHVVVVALRTSSPVLTSDPDDLLYLDRRIDVQRV